MDQIKSNCQICPFQWFQISLKQNSLSHQTYYSKVVDHEKLSNFGIIHFPWKCLEHALLEFLKLAKEWSNPSQQFQIKFKPYFWIEPSVKVYI